MDEDMGTFGRTTHSLSALQQLTSWTNELMWGVVLTPRYVHANDTFRDQEMSRGWWAGEATEPAVS